MEKKQRLKSAIIEVVENQIQSNDPPETEQTLNRLISEGCTSQEAKELIGKVVVNELFSVMKEEKPFDLDRYIAGLNRLPHES